MLGIAGVYFIGPLVAAISFTIQDPSGGVRFDAYRQIFATPPTGQIGFIAALVYSLEIAALTIVLALTLMLPTQLLLHLALPKWRGIVEVISLFPLVFPPVVLVVGVDDVFTWVGGRRDSWLYSVVSWIRDTDHPLILALLYVILAMPFVYRSLDAGLSSINVSTLAEASRNLGAGWMSVLFRVVVPCLRTSIVSAAFLCFALVMGEYTISSILLYNRPFPVWLAQLSTSDGQEQAAVSVFSLLLVEVMLLLVGTLSWRRTAGRKS